jgi:hypothetical protein
MPNLNINIPDSDETTKGIIEISTQVETDAGTDDTKAITPLKLEQSDLVQTTVAANTAKVTNATHTGEVTGSDALTVDKTAISNKTLVTAAAGDHVLITDATDTDNLKKVNVSDFLGGGLGVLMTFFPPVRFNGVDGKTEYFTQWINSGAETFANAVVLSPVSFTLTSATIQSVSSVGSNESITFNIWVNGTPNALTTTYTMDGTRNQLVTGLSISIAAGDELVVGMESPTWVTNPTAIRLSVNIYGS